MLPLGVRNWKPVDSTWGGFTCLTNSRRFFLPCFPGSRRKKGLLKPTGMTHDKGFVHGRSIRFSGESLHLALIRVHRDDLCVTFLQVPNCWTPAYHIFLICP